jgi:hypothetical protein
VARTLYSVPLLSATIPSGGLVAESLAIGFIYIVRDIQASATTATGSASILDVSLNGLVIAHFSSPLASFLTHYWEGRATGPGGTELIAAAGGTGASWDVTISGYKLVLP